MTRIFWDTNLFIYLFEDHPAFVGHVRELRTRMIERDDVLLTGALTVGEVLVKPVAENNSLLARVYREFFRNREAVTVVPFDLKAAEYYAAIRADRRISHADAIQLSCAATAETDLFLTNDERLHGKRIPGIKFVSSLSRSPV